MFSVKKKILGALTIGLLLAGCDDVDDLAVVRAPMAVQINNGQILRGGACAPLSPWGYPQPISEMRGLQYVCHDGYALQYDIKNGTSDWVVEHLTADNLNNQVAKKLNDVRPDPALNDKISIKLSDYNNNAGWVPGQLFDYKDFVNSKKETSQSNYLTNVVPMNYYLNNGAFDLLNKNIRQWAKDYGEVYVIAGPVYLYGKNYGYIGRVSQDALVVNGKDAKLGTDERGIIAVPNYFYKIILAPKIKQIRVFLIPNQPISAQQLPQYASTLSTIESITGYNMFPQIPTDLKNQLLNQEAQWPIRTGLEE